MAPVKKPAKRDEDEKMLNDVLGESSNARSVAPN